MAKPDYGSFTRLNGSPGNPAIKNKDDAATVPVEQIDGEDIRDYADTFSLDTPDVPVGLVSDASLEPPFSGAAMELFTGKLKFEDSAAFGIYGPAVVSEQFSAEEGRFLTSSVLQEMSMIITLLDIFMKWTRHWKSCSNENGATLLWH